MGKRWGWAPGMHFYMSTPLLGCQEVPQDIPEPLLPESGVL